MKPEHRKMALLAVLLICIALVIADRQADHKTGEVVAAVVRNSVISPANTSAQTSTQTSTQSETLIQPLLARDDYKTLSDNMFSSVVFGEKNVPQIIAPVSVAPPPSVPNLPFSVIGKQRQGQRWEVFLAKADQTLVAHEGDLLASVYQVVSIKPPSMQLLYLPLQQTQTLMIGASFDD